LASELGNPSRATFSRWVHAAAGEILSYGQKRTGVYYAATRKVAELGARWPVYAVSGTGIPQSVGDLWAIAPRGFVFVPATQLPPWFSGEGGRGYHARLPFYLADALPQGYLGRLVARHLHTRIGVPERLTDWQESHQLTALLHAGEDTPGNLLVGTVAHEQLMQRRLTDSPTVVGSDVALTYEALAQAALAGEPPGSSAAGEQPKFTAQIRSHADSRHVLVKFSPQRTTAVGQRWADLLLCEHVAHEVVREAGIPTVQSRIIEGPTRRFLEVLRFDRVGRLGRRAALSLFSVDAEFFGALDTWPAAAQRLCERGWLAHEDVERVRLLWLFSGCIGNSDRHFGNVTLLDTGNQLTLAPMYDVLPMLHAPQGNELVPRTFSVMVPPPGEAMLWQQAARLAQTYWERIIADPRLSDSFRSLAQAAQTALADALTRCGSAPI